MVPASPSAPQRSRQSQGDSSDFKFDASKLDLNKPAETKPAETPKTDGEKTPEKKRNERRSVGDSDPTDDLVLPDDDAPLGELPVEPRAADEPIEIIVAGEDADARIDWYLAHKFPRTVAHTCARRSTRAAVRVDGQRIKAAHRVRPGETISVILPELPHAGPQPEDIPLTILFEDDDLAVIDKPPGMVVHPAKGHWSGTLAAALQFHFDQLSSAGGATRPGIVHRLDRDTSGVIIVAKIDQAHFALTQQFADRTTEKIYEALVIGVPDNRSRLDRSADRPPIRNTANAWRSVATTRTVGRRRVSITYSNDSPALLMSK